jgi:hypothetical protein
MSIGARSGAGKGGRAKNLIAISGGHWLPAVNFNLEEWDAEGLHYETLAICRALATYRCRG